MDGYVVAGLTYGHQSGMGHTKLKADSTHIEHKAIHRTTAHFFGNDYTLKEG